MRYENYIRTAHCETLRGVLTGGRPVVFRRMPGRAWEMQHGVPAYFGRPSAVVLWRPVDRYQKTIVRRLLAQRDAADLDRIQALRAC